MDRAHAKLVERLFTAAERAYCDRKIIRRSITRTFLRQGSVRKSVDHDVLLAGGGSAQNRNRRAAHPHSRQSRGDTRRTFRAGFSFSRWRLRNAVVLIE